MNKRNKTLRVLGFLIFAAGFLIGLGFTIAAVWGDFEASMFDPSLDAEQKLSGFRCPILITQAEPGVFQARIENKTDKPMTRTIRTHISQGFASLFREDSQTITMGPGEIVPLSWEVTAKDAVWGRLVMARSLMFRRHPLPSEGGYCGILAVNIASLSGPVLTGILLATSLILIAVGLVLWVLMDKERHKDRARESRTTVFAITGGMIIALGLSLLGNWLLSGIMLVLTFLLLMVIAAYWAMA